MRPARQQAGQGEFSMIGLRSLPRALAAASIGLLVAGFAPAAVAQQPASLDALRQEMKQMRQQYDEMLRQMRADYEARLGDMERRLRAAEAASNAPPPVAQTAPPPAPSATASNALQGAPPELLGPPTAAPAPPAVTAGPPTPANVAGAAAFNPAIGVVLDGKFASETRDPATYRIPGFMLGDQAKPPDRGFSLGETEISFAANIDQALYGTAIISVERTGTVNVEEAYMQTTALPWGFTVKGGRFFSGIGYMNEQHMHTWDFADAPLPYLAFLNQQYADDGVQTRWLAPSNIFLEFGGELFRGDAFPAAGSANRGVGAYSGFVHLGDDINESSSFRTGLSFLHTKAVNRMSGSDTFTGDDNTGIFDFVYKWAPEGNPTEQNFKLQSEAFLRRERGVFDTLNYAGWQSGLYAQAVYQFMPRWRVGLRYDQVNAESVGDGLSGTVLDNLGATPRRYTAMADYSTSEFGRFRLQFNHDQARPQVDNQIIFQYTVSLGAHGAHIF
jgi:hypothetical protein